MSRKVARIDERARRTRLAIAQAMIALGREQAIDSISVGLLSRRAGIGRSTFYAHYASLGDYLAQSYAGMLEQYALQGSAEPEGEGKVLAVHHILAHIYSAGRFVGAVAQSRERPRMLAGGEDSLRRVAESNLARLRPRLTEAERRAAATFIAGGLMGLMRTWMDNGMRETPDQIRAAFEASACAILDGLPV
jgi:AcrR family transcriptional regulator